VLLDRAAAVSAMLDEIRKLPLGGLPEFSADTRNVWTVDSCLRRALEALFDMGRHVLAKSFASGISEYKEIARRLQTAGVLGAEEATLLERLAGYRNRLVHFYHEVNAEELYQIASRQLGDVSTLRDALLRWMRDHPHMVDAEL
jgi:uncharacterized protein YutE (UPF0331/DUF86 family)